MDIVAALFTESFNMRQVAGPSTRLDLTGVYFSTALSTASQPTSLASRRPRRGAGEKPVQHS